MRCNLEELLTTEEAALLLKIHPKTLVRWLEAGRIVGAMKLGRQWRITRDDIQRLLKTVPEKKEA